MISRTHRLFVLGLTVALFAGASAGLVATVLLNSSLDDYAASLFQGRSPSGPTTPRVNLTSEDSARAAVRAVAADSVVLITKASLDTRQPSALINSSVALGYGVVVSTDGWVLLRGTTLADVKKTLPSVDLWIAGVRYTPTQIVADTLTDAVLLKVDASKLVPVAFAASESTVAGTAVWGATNANALLTTTVTNTRHSTGLVGKAEAFVYDWQLAATETMSLPVFDGHGSLLALTNGDTALPLFAVETFVRNTIRSGQPDHAGFGAYVLDLESALNLDPALRQGQTHGALIIAPTITTSAIAKSSPVSLAGLAVGDIVTEVDASQVDHTHTLAELLALYLPGETVSITYVHNGTTQTTTVTLVDAASLLY